MKIYPIIFFYLSIKKIPLVILSDSRFKDNKRIIFLELIKKIIKRLQQCNSSRQESENYLIRLGFKNQKYLNHMM